MKKVVFSLLSLALASSVAVVTSAKENTANEIKPMAIYYDYEPNNYFDTASPFVAYNGNQINGTLSDNMDEDFYVFTAPSSGYYDFSIAYNNSRVKLSLILWDKNYDDIRIVHDTGNGVSFTEYLTKGEKYYLYTSVKTRPVGDSNIPVPYSIYVYN
ncbi:hypothetical protein I532_01580 [Brevibacillus borstelensis AK1]|uniref:Uncharacterized protein n=1 Tax=Brevibacillus borstelensis AK1 TaxID=1300222 RepID=M8E4P9_9BACL|nr:hypothetical protein [Brevibacillus borstelensis]EMT54256.1 hypothetical protein I532_01580 [Brevibacillus borstelensis AK1]